MGKRFIVAIAGVLLLLLICIVVTLITLSTPLWLDICVSIFLFSCIVYFFVKV